MTLNLILPLFGRVPPPAVVTPAAINLSPAAPGDLGLAPAVWTTRVTTTGGLTQVKWIVGIPGAKVIQFPWNAPNNITVPNYNHGDTINFTGYGTGFTLTKDPSGPNAFFAQGSNGFDTFNVGSETQVSDIRFTIDGAGGTGTPTYTLLNLVSGAGDIQATFNRPGDRLIVKSVDETLSLETIGVVFGGAGTKSLTLTPANPGDLVNAPAVWTTRVNAVGLTQAQWIVLDANWVGSGTTEFTIINLINGTALITCNLLKAGDRLVVKSLDLLTEIVSGQVTFSGSTKSLSMSPSAPGNLTTAPATWQTTVTAIGMTQFKWAVKNADGSFIGNWNTASVSNNTAVIRPTFTAASQTVVVRSLDDLISQESSQVSFGTPANPGGTDYAFANDFVKDLTMGANLERGTAVGAPLSYFQKLKSDGNITHIRHFAPSRLDWSIVDEGSINNYADTVQTAIAAGLKNSFACCDVITLDMLNDQRIKDYVNMCCRVFAARNIDPRYFAIGAWNELGEWTDDNTPYNSIRRYYKDLLRSYFPNHLIITGSANWSAWSATVNPSLEVFDDKRVLYEWHSYPFDAQNVATMQDIQNELNAFKNSKGVVTINGELAQAGETGGTDPATLPGVIYAASRGCWKERPTIWTITGGSYFRMNDANSNDLTSAIASALRDANTFIRAQSGFGT